MVCCCIKIVEQRVYLFIVEVLSFGYGVVVVNVSKWRKVDARTLGIRSGLIPESPWIVMRYLRNKGKSSYGFGFKYCCLLSLGF